MKVILLDNIASLGRKGDIKYVSDGYAMNYLLPQGKAEIATPQNIAKQIGQVKNNNLKIKEKEDIYSRIKNDLDNKTIFFSANSSDKDVLYQGISITTIVAAVKEKYNIDLQNSWFDNKSVLKKIGKHKIILNLPNSQKIVLYINIKAL